MRDGLIFDRKNEDYWLRNGQIRLFYNGDCPFGFSSLIPVNMA